MIEFNGYLNGAAEKHFWKKSRQFGRKMVVLSMSVFLAPVVYFTFRLHDWRILFAYIMIVGLIVLMTNLPPRKKDKMGMLPKKITIEPEDGYMTCIADQYVESKYVDDVDYVYDYGEYYDLMFPFGKYSEKFICQKDLLSKGSIEAFEDLFYGKIIQIDE